MRYYFTGLFLIIINIVEAQHYQRHDFNFDSNYSDSLSFILIDTISNPGNCWQIGKPQKNVLNTAKSNPNVIITDTLNSFNSNDTSSFTIGIVVNTVTFGGDGGFYFNGYYFSDTDSLEDYGMLEFSPDNGNSWINYYTDTAYLNQMHNGNHWQRILFTGQTDDWSVFVIDVGQYLLERNDTMLFKFIFISDGIEDNGDGIMFDDLCYDGMIESIEDHTLSRQLQVYPNPVQDEFFIKNSGMIQELEFELYSTAGILQQRKRLPAAAQQRIHTANLPPGAYVYRIISKKGVAKTGRIIKE